MIQGLIALQVTLEEWVVAHLCEEIENFCKRPMETSQRSYVTKMSVGALIEFCDGHMEFFGDRATRINDLFTNAYQDVRATFGQS